MRSATFFSTLILVGFLFSAAGCERQAGTGRTGSSPTDATPAAVADEKGVSRISFESAGGVEIVGSLYEPGERRSPGVLLLHQWRSNRASYSAFAERLRRQGYTVLAIDGRGFGDSIRTVGGETVSAARSDDAVRGMLVDVDKALGFLAGRENVDPERIGIVGASYGSSLAIIYASGHPRVKATALLSPGINYFGNMKTVGPAGKFGGRALLLAAAEDDKSSADAVRELQKTAGDSPEHVMKVYKRGGHGTNLLNSDNDLDDLLLRFLDDHLKAEEEVTSSD